MASVPSSHRQRTSFYPTPLIGDVLFSERVVCQTKAVPAYGTAHPNSARWPNHKLVFVKERPEPESVDTFDFFYAADRATQDAYNFSFTKADIGGTKFDAVARTYVTLRSAFTPNTPAMGAAMPNTPTGLFTGTYVLAEKKQTRIGEQELDSLYVAETHVYVKRCNIVQLGVDSLNGKALTSTETLYYASEVVTGSTTASALFADTSNAYWGLQSDGTQRTGRQLSCEWYLVTVETVVGGTFGGGVVDVDTFTTNDNYTWPPVLNSYALIPWARRDGGVDYSPIVLFNPEGYSGPCLTTITRTWSKTAFTIPKVEQMLPSRINFSSPLFELNIGECLHTAQTIVATSGSNHPVYDAAITQSQVYPATNYTTWPNTIVAYDDQVPYRGGFLRTRRVVSKPS
jgi:hypothetical protein